MDTREQHVGERLRLAREARHLSKRKAAHLAGVSESRWRQVENGVQYKDGVPYPASTTPETLTKMARAVGEDAGQILEELGFPAEVADSVPEVSDLEDDRVPEVPRPPSRTISLEDFDEREEQLIRTFLLGLQAGRSRTVE
jgi:transcriptional regulator with XRE-family HTH domain